MVNYVLSFCKITGASRIFKRNFYLPLLKPLTPKDALRTLRITGKWLLGAKIQHYIPVLLNHRQKRSEDSEDYGHQVHERMDDYTYMSPIIDQENENHKLLMKVLENSQEENGVFVYTVEDKKYNIILHAQFEFAIRNGEIVDVMVSQKNDKIIVKLKDLKKIPMEIGYYDGFEGEEKPLIYSGEGATTAEMEKNHHHGKYTMSLAKLFEDKEMMEEKWEKELKRIMKKKRRQKFQNTKAFKEMLKQSMKNLNWKKFEEDAKQVIQEIEEPAKENPIAMEIDDLERTKNVAETLSKTEELLNQLPTMKEIPEIIKNMGSASLTEIEGPEEENCTRRRVTGVKVKLSNGKECFVSGQMVHTEDGDVFVPGQTVQNEFGEEYAPGITINIGNKPTLINGLIMGEEERDPMFLPTESTITSDGQLTFATAAEERPPPLPEEKKLKRQTSKMFARLHSIIVEEIDQNDEVISNQEIFVSPELEEAMNNVGDHEEKFGETEDVNSSDDSKSIELNSSEIEELDIESINLRQEQQRREIERLKLMLLDDGMDDVISNLEDKKKQLLKKLEELRQLTMNSQNNLITYMNDSDAFEAAAKLTQDIQAQNRLADILIVMVRRLATFRDKNNVKQENILKFMLKDDDCNFSKASEKLKILLKTAIVAGNDVFRSRPKDQLTALHSVTEILSQHLMNDENTLQELFDLMNTSHERNEVCNSIFRELTARAEESKSMILQNIVEDPASNFFSCLPKICNSVVCEPFIKVAKVSPEIIKHFVQKIKTGIVNNEEVENTSEEAVVKAIHQLLDDNLKTVNQDELIEEVKNFAEALDCNLQELDELKKDSFFKRIILINLLAERDYSLKSSINRLNKNPSLAKSDPRIRQLIRESAVLLSKSNPLRSSRDIPLKLMKKQNMLAIEDFVMQRHKSDSPLLISRGSLEAVVPKEAARGVLAGRIPYILIDESGVTNFKPMHMITAVNVNKNRESRIDDYLSASPGRRNSSLDRENKAYLHAKNNVRKLRKMFNSRRQVA